nr:MAG TPA: DNA-binding transcriptional regulator [Caudoviricetes sp.]
MKYKILTSKKTATDWIIDVLSEDELQRTFEIALPVAEAICNRLGCGIESCVGEIISDVDIRYAEIIIPLELVRQEMDMSVRDLSGRAGVARASVARMLKAGARLDSILAIADVFGYTLSLTPVETSAPKYLLHNSKEPGYMVATDTHAGVVLKFKKGNLNGDQQITVLEDDETDPIRLARLARGITEWLRIFHPDLI